MSSCEGHGGRIEVVLLMGLFDKAGFKLFVRLPCSSLPVAVWSGGPKLTDLVGRSAAILDMRWYS